jgi:hypothetical protein
MSATIGAALKKIAAAILLDKRNWEKIACLLVAVVMLVLFPVVALAAVVSTEGMDFNDPAIVEKVIENLTPEQVDELKFVENTVLALHLAMTDRTPEQIKAAEVLYILALYDLGHESDFIDKLTGCFAEDQTDEELISEVNATFGTTLNPDDFSAIMNYANHQMVEIAKSQLGNVGGEPYWSWYGFGGRVEWCACFVSWCADQCGYIDRGIIPKFAGCGNGVDWFKDKNQWLDGSATPESGNIIFFDWVDEYGIQDGNSDHVGIVEKVEGGRVYTIEGNSGDACQQNSYPVGYFEILGYGTPSLF